MKPGDHLGTEDGGATTGCDREKDEQVWDRLYNSECHFQKLIFYRQWEIMKNISACGQVYVLKREIKQQCVGYYRNKKDDEGQGGKY